MSNTRTTTFFILAAGMAAAISSLPASANPFAQADGAAKVQMAEGKCGQGKCGAGMMGGGMKGTGKCGMRRMDTDGDGTVTREEFIKGHEAMFDRLDSNGDGVLDADERQAHRQMMRQNKGKCGAQ